MLYYLLQLCQYNSFERKQYNNYLIEKLMHIIKLYMKHKFDIT